MTNSMQTQAVVAPPPGVHFGESPTVLVELQAGKRFAVWLPGEGVEREFVRGVPARILKRDLPVVMNVCGWQTRGFVCAFKEVAEPPPPPVVPGMGDIVVEELGRR